MYKALQFTAVKPHTLHIIKLITTYSIKGTHIKLLLHISNNIF